MKVLVAVLCLTLCGCAARQPVIPPQPLTPYEQCRADAQQKRKSCVACWWWWLGGPELGLIAGSICTGQCQQQADNMDLLCTVAAMAQQPLR